MPRWCGWFAFGQGLLQLLVQGYPDRLGKLAAGPVNMGVRAVFGLLKPFMPRRLPGKIHLMGNPSQDLTTLISAAQVRGQSTRTQLSFTHGGVTTHAVWWVVAGPDVLWWPCQPCERG